MNNVLKPKSKPSTKKDEKKVQELRSYVEFFMGPRHFLYQYLFIYS